MTRIWAVCMTAPLLACGGSGGGDDHYKGVAAGPGSESGILTVVKVSHEFTSHATYRTGSASIPISGSLDPVLHSFQLAQNGYSFVGRLLNGVITGLYSGPVGNGAFALQSEGNVKATYCGTGSGSGGMSGNFNVVQGNDGSVQVVYSAAGSSASLIGVATGTLSGTSVSATDAVNSATVTATVAATGVNGNYTSSNSSGTFTATSANCPP